MKRLLVEKNKESDNRQRDKLLIHLLAIKNPHLPEITNDLQESEVCPEEETLHKRKKSIYRCWQNDTRKKQRKSLPIFPSAVKPLIRPMFIGFLNYGPSQQ